MAMSQNIDIEGNLAQSEANKIMPEIVTNAENSQIPDIMKFEDLKISHWDENDEINTKLEQDRVENFEDYVSPHEIISGELQDNEIPEFQGHESDFPFPPVLFRRKKQRGEDDDACSLYVLQSESDDASDQPSYDSDDTCDNYVDCGEEGMCKCRRMQGRQYYDYYLETKDKEIHTMYPRGRVVLPRGAVFHFTVNTDAPELRREDIKKELLDLGAKVEFVDYQKGHKEGWVRLSFSHEARIIIKKMQNKKLIIADVELAFRVISGKEEKRYLEKVTEEMFKVRKKAQSRKLKKQLKKAGYQYVKKSEKKNKKSKPKPKGNPTLDGRSRTQCNREKEQTKNSQCEGEEAQSKTSQCEGEEGQSKTSQYEGEKEQSINSE